MADEIRMIVSGGVQYRPEDAQRLGITADPPRKAKGRRPRNKARAAHADKGDPGADGTGTGTQGAATGPLGAATGNPAGTEPSGTGSTPQAGAQHGEGDSSQAGTPGTSS